MGTHQHKFGITEFSGALKWPEFASPAEQLTQAMQLRQSGDSTLKARQVMSQACQAQQFELAGEKRSKTIARICAPIST